MHICSFSMSDILDEDFLEELRGVRSPTSMNFSADRSSPRTLSNEEIFLGKLPFHPPPPKSVKDCKKKRAKIDENFVKAKRIGVD